MTRRPHLSVTPMGLAYVSGDWHDRDSALHAERAIHQARAEQMLDTIVRNQE